MVSCIIFVWYTPAVWHSLTNIVLHRRVDIVHASLWKRFFCLFVSVCNILLSAVCLVVQIACQTFSIFATVKTQLAPFIWWHSDQSTAVWFKGPGPRNQCLESRTSHWHSLVSCQVCTVWLIKVKTLGLWTRQGHSRSVLFIFSCVKAAFTLCKFKTLYHVLTTFWSSAVWICNTKCIYLLINRTFSFPAVSMIFGYLFFNAGLHTSLRIQFSF